MLNDVKTGHLGMDKIKERLEDSTWKTVEVFTEIGNGIEDLYRYVEEIEDHIEVLNTKLIDNTPEHVELVVSFIETTTRQISVEAIKEKVSVYSETVASLKTTANNLLTWKNEFVKKDNEEKTQYKQEFEKFNKTIDTFKVALYWNSLPAKLVEELTSSSHIYNLYFPASGWEKTSEEKFKSALNSKHYDIPIIENDFDVEIKTYKKLPLQKNTVYDTILFNNI